MEKQEVIRMRAEVQGIVQGVGFRPFVYQLAHRLHLAGFVQNTSFGVELEVQGLPDEVGAFFQALNQEAPPLAYISKVDTFPSASNGEKEFVIRTSSGLEARTALISPDVAVCQDCLAEMLDPSDRRYLYPFINCTNCGPRYTIIEDIPYDRHKTSMRVFSMCPRCEAEYHDPSNRRFHAQPNACPICGPRVSLLDAFGRPIPVDDPVAAARGILKKGRILAVKGLGGFHLAVDALNSEAVRLLRQRKKREEKPLAVMAPDLRAISQFALISATEEKILTSVQRPIVLLEARRPSPLAPETAPDNKYIGVMLPYTPLHYLLLQDFLALVMTSGNLSDEPIAVDNQEALQRLDGIADNYLVHNRNIYLRTDDSVVRAAGSKVRQIRRSRGFVPAPIFLRRPLPSVLAMGGELKNTICLTKGDRAFLSQHIGDLENLQTLEFFDLTVQHLERILEIKPEVLACDLHPDYLSTKMAFSQNELEVIQVQHHHAHIVSALAEHHLDGPVIGLACDGTGYGEDGQIWGGELLVADTRSYERRGHLDYAVLPGGAAAIKEPWRMAVSLLDQAFGHEITGLKLNFLAERLEKVGLLRQIIQKRLNSPLTSSLGRLFDGVAAMIGLRDEAAFEGQAAMMLEMCCPPGDFAPFNFDLAEIDGQLIIKFQALIRDIVQALYNGRSQAEISGRFHATVVRALSEAARKLSLETGLKTVVLSGGCFQNQILVNGLAQALSSAGLTVYSQDQVPVNDGGLSLGQAVCAGERLAR